MLILPKFTAEGSTFPKGGNWDVFKLNIYIYIYRKRKKDWITFVMFHQMSAFLRGT